MAYHRTAALVDLSAIEYNIDSVRKKISDDTKLLVIIKSDAYGHGSKVVAKFLEDKCDYFGVACIEEAIELRKEGVTKPILLLSCTNSYDLEWAVKYDITMSICTYESAKILSDEAVRQNKVAKIHFAVDTGMSRIGFQVSEDEAKVCKQISELQNLCIEGVFSHFATADEKDLSKSIEQRNKFDEFIELLAKQGICPEIKHINNSAGIMNFNDKCYNMVRSGIVTYGYYPSEDVDKSLLDIKPAMKWVSHISHIKKLEKGREISYGGTFVTNRDSLIATVPVGYADGFSRSLSNKGKVLINGQFADIVGRICMDQFMIDVTDIRAELDETVVLFGESNGKYLSVEEVSETAGTFNYEFLCGISRRVPRKYIYDNKEIKTVNYLVD